MPISNEGILPWLFVAMLPAFAGVFCFVRYGSERTALALLMLSALAIRLILISADPFLHEWDERFHALVAKNMMEHPFVPMLRVHAVLPYDPASWCCNHIWVHKQPLFLWQMALSMKAFGANVFAMRLPSAIMGCVGVYLTYGIAKDWTQNSLVAITAALLSAFSYYQIELTTGVFATDHNDVAFVFYVTAAIWAFTRYLRSPHPVKMSLVIGLLVGCEILVKWLTALVVFGGWGLYMLLCPNWRTDKRRYLHVILAVMVAAVICIPWQVYIIRAFPLESAASYRENWLHITQVLGSHDGSIFYHFARMRFTYSLLLIPFMIVGVIRVLKEKHIDRALSIAMLTMVSVVYVFFSVFVATKMRAFTFPVQAILLTLAASGIIYVLNVLFQVLKWDARDHISRGYTIAFLLMIGTHALKPWDLLSQRSVKDHTRNAKLHNTEIYTSLKNQFPDSTIVFNCKVYEDVELMFFQNVTAYNWWPDQPTLDSLKALGYHIAAFARFPDEASPEFAPPDYLMQDSTTMIIPAILQ